MNGKSLLLTTAALVAVGALADTAKEGTTVHVNDRDVYVHAANYDKSKIPPYTLENPLRFADGRAVTKENWPARALATCAAARDTASPPTTGPGSWTSRTRNLR